MKLLIAWVINAGTLLIAAQIVPGFKIADVQTAFLAAVIIGLINIFIRPLLLIITLPINLLTLGLFTFVVNAIVIWLASLVVTGMQIENFMAVLLAAIVVSIVSTILSTLAKDLKLT